VIGANDEIENDAKLFLNSLITSQLAPKNFHHATADKASSNNNITQ